MIRTNVPCFVQIISFWRLSAPSRPRVHVFGKPRDSMDFNVIWARHEGEDPIGYTRNLGALLPKHLCSRLWIHSRWITNWKVIFPFCLGVFWIDLERFCRIFWITYILVGMGCVVYVTLDILAGWTGDAFYMTLDASSLEITDLDFPAVAVCDINRISKQRAIQLAKNL